MPIKEADKSYDHKKIEKKIQNFWIEGDTFSKVNKLRANGPQYSFLDGPPYCSGKIHLLGIKLLKIPTCVIKA